MNYQTPKIELIQMDPFISKQQTGRLNPDCNSSTGCDSYWKGYNCIGSEDAYPFVYYFLPGKTCLSGSYNPCTVKVNGQVMACSQNLECYETNCGPEGSRTSGAVIRCSGEMPSLESCEDVDSVEVDCGPDDIGVCTL